MAILIKNADVPKCCKECKFKYAVKCRTYTGFHHKDTERARKCPLVEVWDDYQKCIEALPSAQPEKRTDKRTETHACDSVNRQAAIDTRRYTFGNDEFSLEYAYHDCKLVFDGITDDDSFQEADTGLILYYANEIIYALQEALEGKDTNVPTNDCIRRQEAIDLIEDIETKRLKGEIGLMYAHAIRGLKALPSEQPEIVQCKDCKWWDRYNDYKGYCMAAQSCTCTSNWDIQIRRTYDGDFYCAHAEPKEEYEEGEDE